MTFVMLFVKQVWYNFGYERKRDKSKINYEINQKEKGKRQDRGCLESVF